MNDFIKDNKLIENSLGYLNNFEGRIKNFILALK